MATYIQSSPILWRFQCDPDVDDTCIVEAFFKTTLTNDSDPDDVIVKDGWSTKFTLPTEVANSIKIMASGAIDVEMLDIKAKRAAAKAASLDAEAR